MELGLGWPLAISLRWVAHVAPSGTLHTFLQLPKGCGNVGHSLKINTVLSYGSVLPRFKSDFIHNMDFPALTIPFLAK